MIQSLLDELRQNGSVTFAVNVRPGASVSAVRGVLDDETLKADIAAAPEDGKANMELIDLMAQEFGVHRSQVTIVSGTTDRHKLVRIKA